MEKAQHNLGTSFGWLSLLMICLLSLTALAEDIERTFQVKEGGTLTVVSDLGSIEIETGDNDKVEILVRKRGGWDDDEDDEPRFEVEFEQNGNDVEVRGEYKTRYRNWNRSPKVRFMIKVPTKFDVDLETSGGGIEVGDLVGEVRARTSGGSLAFGNITGPVRGRTSGGSIVLDGCKGKADVSTSGGSIKIGEVDGDVDASTSGGSISIDRSKGNVVASTSGGSISVDEVMGDIDASTSGGSVTAHISQQPKGECRLETSGGNVSVYLAKDIAVDLDAKANGGRVTSDFKVSLAGELRKTRMRGEINGGGPKLYLRTSSGTVRIREL